MVPSKRGTDASPDSFSTCHVSSRATNVPAIGVQSPGIRRIPQPAKNADVIVVLIGGSLHSVVPAPITSADPTTKRMRSRPMPGQPPANVEYRRRKDTPLYT